MNAPLTGTPEPPGLGPAGPLTRGFLLVQCSARRCFLFLVMSSSPPTPRGGLILRSPGLLLTQARGNRPFQRLCGASVNNSLVVKFEEDSEVVLRVSGVGAPESCGFQGSAEFSKYSSVP